MLFKLLKILFLNIIIFYSVELYSQKELRINLKPEENNLYERVLENLNEREYLKAYQGFSQLLSLYPNEPVFKYYFAICKINLRQNFNKAIEYLNDASNVGIYESYFYIAMAYHYLYDFENAIKFYNKFKSKARPREIRDYDVNRYIEKATSGKELIQYAYELKVVNYRELDIQNFHYSYDFSNLGGRIIIKPERYRTRLDRNIKHPDLMYISDIHNVIYMSSYGNRRGSSLNIYKIERENGEWGEPQKLPPPINDDYDQAFPFIAQDGITLYFSSKGHSSMGGYDIFKSVYDTINNIWSEPKNLDFPINTPFDDIMFVSDIYNQTAFFSSNRRTQDDRLAIYRIILEIDPPKRLISDLDDVHNQASLRVTQSAIAELEKIEEQRKEFESRDIKTIGELDRIDDSMFFIADNIQEKIDSIKHITNQYKNIAALSFQNNKEAINEINFLKNEIETIKDTDDKEKINQLNKEIFAHAQKANVNFNITNYYLNEYEKINNLLDKYQKKLNTIQDDEISDDDALKINLYNLYNDIGDLDFIDPERVYIRNKISKIESIENIIKSENTQINKLKEDIDYVNNQIDSLSNIVLGIDDEDIRKNIIGSISNLEQKQKFTTQQLKNHKINKAVYKNDIYNIQNKIQIAQESLEKEVLYDYPEIDLSEILYDIETIASIIENESDSRIAEIKEEIDSEIVYESRLHKIVYEIDKAIALKEQEKKALISEYLQQTSRMVRDFHTDFDEKIIDIDNLIVQKDSLENLISEKEEVFDNTVDEAKRLEIINEINLIKTELKQADNNIKAKISEYSFEDLTFADIDEYKKIKKSADNYDDLQNIIIENDILITNIKEIREKIQIISLDDTKPNEKQYFEILEHELTKKLAENIELITEHIEIQEFIQSGEIISVIQDEVFEVQKQKNIYSDNLISLQNDLFEYYDDIINFQQIVETTENERRKRRAENRLNRIIPETKKLHLEYLETKLIIDSIKNSTYNKYYENHKQSIDSEMIVLQEKQIEYYQKAQEYMTQARTTLDTINKINLLTQAEKNIELSNLYYQAIFDIMANNIQLSDADKIINKEETTKLHLITEKVIAQVYESKLTEIPSYETQVITDNINQINYLLEESIIIEEQIQTYIQEFIFTENDKYIIEIIDSLNNLLLEKIFITNKLIVENQVKQMQYNIETRNTIIDFEEYKELVDKYITDAEKAIDERNYYLLSEIIIHGEAILKVHSDDKIFQIQIPDFTKNISDLVNRYNSTSSWINDNIADLSIVEADVSEVDIIIEDTEKIVSSEILDKYITYDDLLKEELNELEREIEKIIFNINEEENEDIKENLIYELEIANELLKTNIIEISNLKTEVFKNIFEITEKKIPYIEREDYVSYIQLHDELLSIRDTIKNYDIFSDIEHISKLDKRADKLESEIISIIHNVIELNEFASIIKTLLVAKTDKILVETIDKDIDYKDERIIRIKEKIKVEDYKVINKYDKLKEQRNKLLQEKSEKLSELESLQADLNRTHRRRNQTNLQNQIEKLEKDLLVQMQELAKTEIEILNIEYDIAIKTYSDLSTPGEVIDKLSDSLMLKSVSVINQAKYNYDKIIQSDKVSDVYDILKIASEQVETGLDILEKSINIKSINNIEDSLVIAYIEEEFDGFEFLEEITEKDEISVDDIAYDHTEQFDEIIEDYSELEETTSVTEELPLSHEIFAEILTIAPESSESFYSDNKPIPEMTEKPSGLSYRIQIGAFGRNVPNETFRAISPILIENIPGSRWVRYVVGLFYTFDNAYASLPEVRALGYNDCFIVAYYNDERIPLYRAREIERQMIAEQQTTRYYEDETVSATQIQTQEVLHEHSELQYQNINEISDVFFTVQVGVYRELVRPERLFGLSPLNYERIQNGLIRHLFGKYFNYNLAVNEQNRIRQLGVTDAFVVAYSNGSRIPISQARTLLQTHERPVIHDELTELTIDDTSDTIVDETTIPTEIIDDRPVYYVQVGAYRRSVVANTRQLFENIAGNYSVFEITDEATLIIYRIGRFSTYQEALLIQNNARNNGISDAFIIAVINGQRVSVSEARSRE